MKNISDEELVNNYLETRQNIYFGQLYERYCQKVHQKCLAFTKDKKQAEDLTQDIFLRLIGKLESYKHQAKFSTWLYSITYNYCTDLFRSKRWQSETSLDDNWDKLTERANQEVSDHIEWQVQTILHAMRYLPSNEQTLLLQRYQEEASIRDIATYHSLTESAVKMRLKRSRDRLRHYYWKINTK